MAVSFGQICRHYTGAIRALDMGRVRGTAAVRSGPVRCAVPGIGIATSRCMRGDSGHTRSPWFASANTPPRPPLAGDSRAEVCVIGAGIAGLSVAYHLACEGRSVIVLDDGPIGGGQSGRTTAHPSNAIDDLYVEIARVHGADGARLAA